MKIPFLPQLPNEFRRDAVAMTKVLAPPVFIGFMGLLFHDFVVKAILANVYINIGIMCTGAYGVGLIFMRLLAAQKDFLVIERFGREALNGVPMEELLEEPWLKRKYVRHYLAHIAQTGGTISSQLDQNAIENELHALNGEYESKLELPQFLVGLMIAMGLLGTFIGLLTTLTGVAGMLDELGVGGDIQSKFAKLVVDLRAPLAGMGIAFSASMFGLICSLMLSVMMTNLRRYINRVMALARNVMHDLVKLSRPTAVSGYPDGARSATSTAGEREMAMVASRIDLMIKKMELLIQAVEQSAGGQQRLNDLLGFGPRMKELSERTLEELKKLGAGSATRELLQKKLVDAQVDTSRLLANLFESHRAAKETGDKHLEAIRTLSVGLSDQSRLLQKSIEMKRESSSLLSSVVDAQRQTKEVNERIVEGVRALATGQGDLGKLLQHIADINGDVIRLSETALEAQRQQATAQEQAVGELHSLVVIQNEQRQTGQVTLQGLEQIALSVDNSSNLTKSFITEILSNVQTVGDRLVGVEDAQIGGAKHLFAIKETLTKLSQNLSVVDMVSTGIGQQTILLESLVAEAKNSQNTLFAIQQELRQGGEQEQGEPTTTGQRPM